MGLPLDKLHRLLPDWPRRKYNTFTGTNLPAEWWLALRGLLAGSHQDAGVIRAYESAMACAMGCRDAFTFAAGRMAFYCALEALDLRPGDEVIVPGFTCVVVPNALLYRGLRPVYADIEPVTFNVVPEAVEALITSRTRAIYLQHTFGVSGPAKRLREIASRNGLYLIEDVAHSLGATCGGQRHGSFGDVSYVSTDRSKVINTHLGGAVATNDATLAARLRKIQARTPFPPTSLVRRQLLSFLVEYVGYAPALLWAGRPVVSSLKHLGILFYWRDELSTQLPTEYPYPARLASSQAALGISQLAQLESNLDHRRRIAAWLDERVRWYPDRPEAPLETQTWLRYSFLIQDRARFERALKQRFDLSTWFTSVLFCRDGNLDELGYRAGCCPVAERVARHIVNFPTHPRVPLDAIRQAWESVGGWVEGALLRPEQACPSGTPAGGSSGQQA
jgi:dTDP-4-amino-4,6-dideoxygalactose transaminase